jgi:exonuclease III
VNKAISAEMERLRTKALPSLVPSKIHHPGDTLKIGHLNIGGCLKRTSVDKTIDLKLDEDIQCLDIVCLTETHLNYDDSFSETDLSGNNAYAIKRRDRTLVGGGVLIAVKNQLLHKPINLDTDDLEVVCSSVEYASTIIYVFCVYLPPQLNKRSAASRLQDILTLYEDKKCIVLGDFNECLLDSNDNSMIQQTLTQMGFNQHIQHATRDYGSKLYLK